MKILREGDIVILPTASAAADLSDYVVHDPVVVHDPERRPGKKTLIEQAEERMTRYHHGPAE